MDDGHANEAVYDGHGDEGGDGVDVVVEETAQDGGWNGEGVEGAVA